jgi:hypothetical protein
LSNVAGILSGPVALLSSRERRIRLTSSGEIVISPNGLQDVQLCSIVKINDMFLICNCSKAESKGMTNGILSLAVEK